MIRSIPVIALLAVGCTPQSASMTDGMMWGFMSETTSFSLISGDFDTTDAEESWNIDCRANDPEFEAETLPDALDVCEDNSWPPVREAWLDRGAFRAFSEPMEPWRGEGFITFEGDFQVGFHTRLPGGEDFRFQFALNPIFEPTRCVQEGDGVVAEAVDGDWLAEWANHIDVIAEQDNNPAFLQAAAEEFAGGKMYFLNARSFQFNPNSTDVFWSLPQEWQAGFAAGSFIDEDLRGRPSRYADPEAHAILEEDEITVPTADQVWYSGCPDGILGGECASHTVVAGLSQSAAIDTMDELTGVLPEGSEAIYRPLNYSNDWRVSDGFPPGLDSWAAIHYSWVMLDADSTLEVGGAASGAFQILFDGIDSQSRIVVQGRFEVPKIKKDSWGGIDLQAQKLEQADVELCIR